MSSSLKSAPYGTWESPITTDLLVQKAIRLNDVFVDPTNSKIFHVEGRPDEGGRNVIVDTASGKDVFGSEFNARTMVHEYGGTHTAAYRGKIVFANLSDRNLYLLDYEKGSSPQVVTPAKGNWRYADVVFHPVHPHLLIAIMEDHTKPDPADVVNTLVVVNTAKKTTTVLVEGADFYSTPRISPDCQHLSFVQWFHPDMPWEGGEVVVKALNVTENGDGLKVTGGAGPIAGKRGTTSAQDPKWITDDKLIFLSDETGFLNPYSYSIQTNKVSSILRQPMNEDFGEPPWQFGRSSFALMDSNTMLCTSVKQGRSTLYRVNLGNGELQDLATSFVEIGWLCKVSNESIVFMGKGASSAEALVLFSLPEVSYKSLKETSNIAATIPKDMISLAEPFSFPIPSTNDSVHVIFYKPTNSAYSGIKDETPPCIVHIHGGPTTRTPSGLSWERQYFTSRGWSWLDVNYGGSTGYGIKYIERLRGHWGIVDVEDAVQAVTQIAEKGLIDGKRVAIRGGSAGGFTVLAAVTTHPTFFAAGNSFYGISDLNGLAESTHKFESRYLERLIGGTPEEVPDVYKERSPLFHAVKIQAPLLILQGSEDKVVPPDQAKKMVDIIEKNGGAVKYIEFEGEGHGFRQAKNIKAALEAELAWYKEVFSLA